MYDSGDSFLPFWYIIENVILFQKEKNKNMKNETLNRK